MVGKSVYDPLGQVNAEMCVVLCFSFLHVLSSNHPLIMNPLMAPFFPLYDSLTFLHDFPLSNKLWHLNSVTESAFVGHMITQVVSGSKFYG